MKVLDLFCGRNGLGSGSGLSLSLGLNLCLGYTCKVKQLVLVDILMSTAP